MSENGSERPSESGPKVAHLVIEFDLATGGFRTKMGNGIPTSVLVNALEMTKLQALMDQRQRSAEAALLQQQSGLVIPRGPLPGGFGG